MGIGQKITKNCFFNQNVLYTRHVFLYSFGCAVHSSPETYGRKNVCLCIAPSHFLLPEVVIYDGEVVVVVVVICNEWVLVIVVVEITSSKSSNFYVGFKRHVADHVTALATRDAISRIL